jgi:hypothetical protein
MRRIIISTPATVNNDSLFTTWAVILNNSIECILSYRWGPCSMAKFKEITLKL